MVKSDTEVVPGVQEVHGKTEYLTPEQYDATVIQENDISKAIRETQPLIGLKVSRWLQNDENSLTENGILCMYHLICISHNHHTSMCLNSMA